MAVSDFGFKKVKGLKLKSNDPQAFVEYMRNTIEVNPKILLKIKDWNPDCFLVSFKFEMAESNKHLIELATDSGQKATSNLVVANDKGEMQKLNRHVAYIVDTYNPSSMGRVIKVADSKQEIAEILVSETETWCRGMLGPPLWLGKRAEKDGQRK